MSRISECRHVEFKKNYQDKSDFPSKTTGIPPWVWECNLEDWNSKALLGRSTSTLNTWDQNFCILASNYQGCCHYQRRPPHSRIPTHFKLKFNLNYNLILFNQKFENPFSPPKKIKIKIPPEINHKIRKIIFPPKKIF